MTVRPLFHEQLRHERELRGWSQADLAEKVGCDAKTIGRWENGDGIPRSYHRQSLCEIFGKNAEELGLVPATFAEAHASDPPASLAPPLLREDWGEAPAIVHLYGRDDECAELRHWIGDEHCHVVAVLGMGGVGKTAVAAKIAAQMKLDFEYVFWRSLQNALPLDLFLKQCISFVSHQRRLDLPGEIDDQITLLLQAMRDHRCLLVLDNFESVLQSGRRAGYFRAGYTSYGKLLQRIGEAQHSSCLLLTSREKPKEVAHLEGKSSPVRSLPLAGLNLEAGQHMLQDRGLVGSDAHWLALVERYSGNPLALQVVSEPISEVFEGNIARFLQEEVIAFGDINDLLAQQFHRLSALEREMMSWLAIEREAVSLDALRENLVYPVAVGAQLEALDSLRRRSLIETRGLSRFTLQPVIMEYVTMNLVKRAYKEFVTEAPDIWCNFALCKAQSKDYVRESQARLLLAPVAQRLLAKSGKEGIEQRARNMLASQRQAYARQPGYLAGNMLNLLSHIHCDLRGIDVSRLEVRQAYLQGVKLPESSFAHAHIVASIFSNTFGNILAVACSPREHLLAVGTATGEILMHDTLSGVLHLACHGHSDGVWSLAFSPDGRVLASSSDDHTARLWDTQSGECLRTLQDHTNRVRAVAFSPDGNMLVSGSDDQSIRLWEVKTGNCLKTLHGHSDRVWCVAFSPDGRLLASGSTDQSVRVWDMETDNCIATLRGHSGPVRSVAFHPKENVVASGSDDQTMRLWNIDTGSCLKTLRGHTSRVWCVAFHPTRGMVASGSEDQSIRLWDVSTGNNVMLLQGHYQGVRSLAITPDGQMLVSGGDDQTIRVWDVSRGLCLRIMQGYTNRVWATAFHAGGSMLASASEDATMRLWDIKTGQCLRVLQDRSHAVLTIAFSPSGSTLASGGQDETVRVWDTQTGRGLHVLRGHSNWVRAVIFSSDGKLLASGGEDASIRLWDVKSGNCLRILQGHASWVRSLTFSPDGSLLASGADDATIWLWDATTGFHLRTLEDHAGRIRSVAFSPNGKLLASGSEDATMRLWDITTGRCISLLQGHAGWIRSVAFSPNGKLLASGSEDASIRLWDITTGRCLGVLQGHTNRVRWVTFSPDGNMLASSSDDGTIKCWDAQTYQCLKTLTGERPYENMNISSVQGLTEAQKANLRALGAIEES